MVNKKLCSLLVVLVVVLLLFSGGEHKKNSMPNAMKGSMDLTNWKSKKDGILRLDGQWELYWGQLLQPKDFKENPKLKVEDFLEIPSGLKESTNGQELPKFGYGTIRLNIKMNVKESSEVLHGISTQYILSASKIWVNGQLVASTGVVSKNRSDAVGSYERQISSWRNEGENIEIIIQMSNYNNIAGKIKSIFLGSNEQIKREYVKGLAANAFIIGALFIMGIYHFALYYKRPKNKVTLYFGGACLVIALRTVLVGKRLIFEIFPDIPFWAFNKMAYLTAYCALPLILMFFKELFSEKISSKIVNLTNIITIMISIATVASSIEFYDKFSMCFQIYSVLVLIYVLSIIVKDTVNKNKSALRILSGFAVLLVTIIHDLLVQAGVIYTTSLAPFGLLIFIFFQSYMLAAEFSNAFVEIEKLVEENKAIFTDELTGILNRRGFYEQGGSLYNAALITGGNFIMFYGDLNKFKSINDSFGHKEGDEAIKTTAQILRNSFGKDDIVARMSGDEFIIIAVNKAPEEANGILKHLKKNFDKYNSISNKPYRLLISFGYSVFQSNARVTFEDLIHEADSLLYEEKAKSNFKSSVR